MKNDEKNCGSYWINILLPAGGGLLAKETVLGYFHSRGKLPSAERTRETFTESLHDIGDTLPHYTLGKPGLISTVAGLGIASGLYFLFHRPANNSVTEAEHNGALDHEQLKR